MLKRVAAGVWVHQSDFCQSNAVVVQGQDGVLLVDPGIRGEELTCLANDLAAAELTVIAGFSTHPHWDHLLWDARFDAVPRYATATGAAAIQNVLTNPEWKNFVSGMLPPDIADQIPIDELFGQITALPPGTTELPWDGQAVRVIEHPAHASGHAALLIEDSSLLLAGDMLSDLLIPILNFRAADPIADYLAGLQLLADVADSIKLFIPGHGSVGDATELQTRIKQDQTYVEALRDGTVSTDPRITQHDWVADVHQRQVTQLTQNGVA